MPKQSNVKQSVAALKVAHQQRALNGHPASAALAAKGREVACSWGTAMKR